jgi:hypothetical protein
MNRIQKKSGQGEHKGIRIGGAGVATDPGRDTQRLRAWLDELGLLAHVRVQANHSSLCAGLAPESSVTWAPQLDTTALGEVLADQCGRDERHTEREVLSSLLLSPLALDFPDFDEFESAVRIRVDTAQAGAATALRFDIDQYRPEAYWERLETGSFSLRPGCSLVGALAAATQPGPGEDPYGFGCYRASEYVMLLAIAREAARSHPELKQRLRERSTRRPIESREFHDVLLRELGTFEEPVPACWFVPGDRIWFRNPDAHSADAEGFEGSWVIYIGDGLFSNFWKRNAPFTLERKCVEIYHWRNATYRGEDGGLRVDEDEVARRVALTEADPVEHARVLALMQRWRDPRGVYEHGGCLDRTRECARWVQPDSCDIVFSLA